MYTNQTFGQRFIFTQPVSDVQILQNLDEIKQKFADLSDTVNAISTHNIYDEESARLVKLALEHLEVASMYASKAMTVNPRVTPSVQ
jgi:hypothetical protein